MHLYSQDKLSRKYNVEDNNFNNSINSIFYNFNNYFNYHYKEFIIIKTAIKYKVNKDKSSKKLNIVINSKEKTLGNNYISHEINNDVNVDENTNSNIKLVSNDFNNKNLLNMLNNNNNENNNTTNENQIELNIRYTYIEPKIVCYIESFFFNYLIVNNNINKYYQNNKLKNNASKSYYYTNIELKYYCKDIVDNIENSINYLCDVNNKLIERLTYKNLHYYLNRYYLKNNYNNINNCGNNLNNNSFEMNASLKMTMQSNISEINNLKKNKLLSANNKSLLAKTPIVNKKLSSINTLKLKKALASNDKFNKLKRRSIIINDLRFTNNNINDLSIIIQDILINTVNNYKHILYNLDLISFNNNACINKTAEGNNNKSINFFNDVNKLNNNPNLIKKEFFKNIKININNIHQFKDTNIYSKSSKINNNNFGLKLNKILILNTILCYISGEDEDSSFLYNYNEYIFDTELNKLNLLNFTRRNSEDNNNKLNISCLLDNSSFDILSNNIINHVNFDNNINSNNNRSYKNCDNVYSNGNIINLNIENNKIDNFKTNLENNDISYNSKNNTLINNKNHKHRFSIKNYEIKEKYKIMHSIFDYKCPINNANLVKIKNSGKFDNLFKLNNYNSVLFANKKRSNSLSPYITKIKKFN